MQLNDLKNKNIHIVGLSGTEGSSLALFLIRLGCKNLTGHDFSTKSQFKKNYQYYHQNLSTNTINGQIKKIKTSLDIINYKNHYLNKIRQADIIFAPSSWFRYKINKPLKKIGPGQIFWDWYNLLLEFYPGKIIGVTGTAGKGTTTHLIYQMLKSAKKPVYLAGDAWQMIDFSQIFKSKFLVLELSNRTLTFAENSKKSPEISIITNITKHHLDDHQNSLQKYISIKKEIAKYQKKSNYLIFNNQESQTKKLKSYGQAVKMPYSLKSSERKIITNKNLIGEHLISDAVAAVKAAKILKINKADIIDGLNRFKARQGRMQFVKKVNNINFINDGASTRPQATVQAIKSFPKGKINLILEGSRKKADFSYYRDLLMTIESSKVENIAISGQITKFLFPKLSKTSANIFKTKNLEESVKILFKLARPNQVVLLSPANESFGEFRDYRERIKLFNKIVKKLK